MKTVKMDTIKRVNKQKRIKEDKHTFKRYLEPDLRGFQQKIKKNKNSDFKGNM